MSTVKAFTIWELIVVMAISGIVIALGAGAYFRIQAFFSSNSDQFSSGIQVVLLKDLMKRDIENSVAVLKRSNLILLECNGQDIEYLITDSAVIRKETGVPDTFLIEVKSVVFKVLEDHPDYIRSIDLSVSGGGLSCPVYFHKHYDKKFLFGLEKACGH